MNKEQLFRVNFKGAARGGIFFVVLFPFLCYYFFLLSFFIVINVEST